MTQCSITYIPPLCLVDVAASLFLQLHVSREWGCSVVGGWEGVGSMSYFCNRQKKSSLDAVEKRWLEISVCLLKFLLFLKKLNVSLLGNSANHLKQGCKLICLLFQLHEPRVSTQGHNVYQNKQKPSLVCLWCNMLPQFSSEPAPLLASRAISS